MVEVDLKCPEGHAPVRVLVNGAFAVDVVLGRADTAETLLAEVAAARALKHLPRIVNDMADTMRKLRNVAEEGKTADQKAKGFCDGLADGLAEKLVAHPEPGIAPFRPSEGNAYDLGYAYGDAVRRCLRLCSQVSD